MLSSELGQDPGTTVLRKLSRRVSAGDHRERRVCCNNLYQDVKMNLVTEVI